jgi:hypothetical protein
MQHPTQAFRFVKLYSGDAEAALNRKCRGKRPNSVRYIPVLYFVGSRLGSARAENATFNIVKILVIGIVTSDGVRTVLPTEYFSSLEVDERDA